MARYLPDGTIECLGRMDHQVKIRGFRIELGEIEAVLGQHPGIEESVVIVREDVPGDKRLVGYLIANQEPVPTVGELRSFLKQKLPDYMVPSAFVELEAMPLTPNRKVDRKALPKPQTDGSLEQGYVAPRTEAEQKIAEVWQEVLNTERVGVTDDFFEFGGHSLLATQVMSRINKLFNIKLPLRRFFEATTIEALAEVIDISLWNSQDLQKSGTKGMEEREVIEL
jgi:acyl carrier protein